MPWVIFYRVSPDGEWSTWAMSVTTGGNYRTHLQTLMKKQYHGPTEIVCCHGTDPEHWKLKTEPRWVQVHE